MKDTVISRSIVVTLTDSRAAASVRIRSASFWCQVPWPTVTLRTVHRILQNPIYYGEVVWLEKAYKGWHEPLITRDLF
jgi:Recombinase